MFLTRFHLDARSRAGAAYLENPQRLHAAVYRAMPTQPVVAEGEGGRPLWRLDRDDTARPLLWIASPECPKLDALADEAGRAAGGLVYESKPYGPLLEHLDRGQTFAFRLGANAVHNGRRSPGSEDTQRFAHVTASQQLMWLEERSSTHGFALRVGASGEWDAAVVGRRRAVFRRGQQRVTIVVSEFRGHLEVTDPNILRRSLVTGIGHARAYGCGLLTLAAPRLG